MNWEWDESFLWYVNQWQGNKTDIYLNDSIRDNYFVSCFNSEQQSDGAGVRSKLQSLCFSVSICPQFNAKLLSNPIGIKKQP